MSALQNLLIDVQARRIDVIVVYKVDRLTRSLADFAKLVETFDAHGEPLSRRRSRRRRNDPEPVASPRAWLLM
jgi:Resolvase, N terminal domain